MIADGVKSVGASAFMDTEHLERLTVGKGVRQIGRSAFERCPSLKQVVVQGGVESIGKNAFRDCINLEKLILLSGVVPEIESGIFDNISTNFRILVPEQYLRNYLRVIEWGKYHSLFQAYHESSQLQLAEKCP